MFFFVLLIKSHLWGIKLKHEFMLTKWPQLKRQSWPQVKARERATVTVRSSCLEYRVLESLVEGREWLPNCLGGALSRGESRPFYLFHVTHLFVYPNPVVLIEGKAVHAPL